MPQFVDCNLNHLYYSHRYALTSHRKRVRPLSRFSGQCGVCSLVYFVYTGTPGCGKPLALASELLAGAIPVDMKPFLCFIVTLSFACKMYHMSISRASSHVDFTCIRAPLDPPAYPLLLLRGHLLCPQRALPSPTVGVVGERGVRLPNMAMHLRLLVQPQRVSLPLDHRLPRLPKRRRVRCIVMRCRGQRGGACDAL